MSINKAVMKHLNEETGSTAGVEMINTWNQFPKSQIDSGAQEQIKNTKAGDKVVEQPGTNQSKFDKDSTPGNHQKPANNASSSQEEVNKFGGNKDHAHQQTLQHAIASAQKNAGKKVVKSPNVTGRG